MQKCEQIEAKKLKILFKMMEIIKNLKFVYQFELRGQQFHAFETTNRVFLHVVK